MGTEGREPYQRLAMKHVIVNALERQAASQRFSEITVTGICGAAKISRTTFYHCFSDKYDVLQWHYNDICHSRLYEAGRSMTWSEANFANISELLRHRTLYSAGFSCSKGYQSLTAYGRRRLKEVLCETVTAYHDRKLDEDLLFQISFFVNGATDAFAKWGREGMTASAADFARRINSCVPPELAELLEPVPYLCACSNSFM